MAINILDSMIINRISAGEVVESPFSIVKELIDNSLDAGATNIYVEIKNGGIDYIQVKDNGHGIEKDDIVKAFLPHATSKIKDIDDLNSIVTLGFRGEALASISNVSQVSLITKVANSDCSYQLNVNGGVFGEITPTISEMGTKIEVNNLFYNTPARRKFLKKPKSEEVQITNIMTRYILAHPNISFKYVVNEKTVYQTRGKSLMDVIYCVYGEEFTQNIMPVNKKIGNISLSGYVSKVGFSKPNTTYQTLIINSRYVVDEIVSKASYMAYEEYLMTRQFPVYILNIDMPVSDVDVNVHPSKLNVKFANPSKIYDLVYTAIRSAIYEFLNPMVEKKATEQPISSNPLIHTDIDSLKEISIEPNVVTKMDNVAQLKQTTFSPITIFDLKQQTNLEQTDKSTNNDESTTSREIKDIDSVSLDSSVQSKTDSTHLKDVADFIDYKIIGELFNEFLLLEKGDNLLLLDFHAGHERLNYDKYSKMISERDLVIQDLLVPYVQEMTETELDFILSLKDELSKLGFDIDTFSEHKIIINSIPMQLKDINLKSFIDDIIHDTRNLKPSMNNEIKHYLMQKACKNSVKSGMKLSEFEIKELLKNLDEKNPVLLCPHGRPVLTVINRAQIEKWFKRIV